MSLSNFFHLHIICFLRGALHIVYSNLFDRSQNSFLHRAVYSGQNEGYKTRGRSNFVDLKLHTEGMSHEDIVEGFLHRKSSDKINRY